MGTRSDKLIIPVEYVDDWLYDATDEDGKQTDAIYEATAFVNTYAIHYEDFDAYTTTTGSGDEEDTYTINAPRVIEHITKNVAVAIYHLSIAETWRNSDERIYWEERKKSYAEMLKEIEIQPEWYSATVSLDSNGYQLLETNKHIIPWTAYIESASSNVWNNGEDFYVVKGPLNDSDSYRYESWYLDGSNESSDLEGTIYYERSFRNDGRDYMKRMKTGWNHN